MKIKWRTYERLFVTIILAVVLMVLIVHWFKMSPYAVEAMSQPFIKDGRPFNYFTNVFAPQAISLLLIYGCYWWINWVVEGLWAKRKRWLVVVPLAILQLLAISYLLGPGTNFLSFYSNPYIGGGAPPLVVGYHPQTFFKVFGGWAIAMFLVALYVAYVLFREIAIALLEKGSEAAVNYRVLVFNRVSLFTLIYLVIDILVWEMVESDYRLHSYYLSFVPAAVLLVIRNYYYVFPGSEGLSFSDSKLIRRALASMVYTTAPFILVLAVRDAGELWAALVMVQLLIVTPISWAIYQNRKDTLQAFIRAKVALSRTTADLQNLKAQINPHFLFNSLNALYATALRENSTDTATGIQRLGDMMRFMLHDNQQDRIPLHREVDYLNDYLALQRLRIGDAPNVRLTEHVAVEDENLSIAPMLIIPFVENAFKHGISLENPSWILIGLHALNGKVTFEIRNSIHPTTPKDPDEAVSGTGLRNVRERLALLYPGRHELQYGAREKEYVVHLSIQI